MEFAPNPAPVATLAHGAQIIATNVNVAAGLCVAAAGNEPAAAARAFEPAIVIDDLANTAIQVIDTSLNPGASPILANGAQGVAVRTDITAGLGIGSSGYPVAITVSIAVVVPVAISIAVSVIVVAPRGHAAQLAGDILNRAIA